MHMDMRYPPPLHSTPSSVCRCVRVPLALSPSLLPLDVCKTDCKCPPVLWAQSLAAACARVKIAAAIAGRALRRQVRRACRHQRRNAAAVKRGVRRVVVVPVLRGANKGMSRLAALLPGDDAPRIDASGLLRAGTLQWLGVHAYADRFSLSPVLTHTRSHSLTPTLSPGL